METFKKILKKLLFPHAVIIALLAVASVVLLVFSFIRWGSESVPSYISYVVSAYTMTVICVRIPDIVKFVKRITEEDKYISRLVNDAHLRVKLSLYGSLLLNAAYAVFQFGLGLFHGSFWFHSLAIYYLLLVVMRFFLLRDVRSFTPGEDMASELRRYRFCGIILMIMNVALVAIVFFMTYFNRGFEHHFITTIAMAAYTFTALTVAIVNMVKYRRYHSPVFSASKAINFAAALVSMLTLETAMLNAFGDESIEAYRRLMTGLTGLAVCLFVLGLAIFMVVKANRELKKLEINRS